MYVFIKGTLVRSTPMEAIIDNHGIGYKLHIAANAFGLLPQIGSEVLFYTSFVVREQIQALYGFLTEQEKDLFEALTNVNGIGPKLALSIIGHLSLNEMHCAIQGGDVQALSRVPGIGKKTAERLIIEMRDKLPGISAADLAITITTNPLTQKINDAMSALIHLGYNQVTAQKAIKLSLNDLSEDVDLASLITRALTHC